MYSSTYLNWFRRLLILGAVVAGLTAAAAGAGIDSRPPDVADVASGLSTQATFDSQPPDVQDAMASLHTTAAGLRADGLRWQGIAQVYQQATPDVFERYAAAHPYGDGQTSSELVTTPPDVQDTMASLPTSDGLKADGLRWQAIARVYEQQTAGTSVRPDDRAGPLGVGESTSVAASGDGSTFAWSDYGIGIGTGIGLILLLGAGLYFGRQQRHRVQTA